LIEVVSTMEAPKAVGPYSQALRHGSLLFCSGQVAINPDTGEVERGSVAEQTRRAMLNLKGVLEAGGSNLDNVLKTTIYLADLQDFKEMNDVYAGYFPKQYPARVTVAVKELYGGQRVEIDAIAAIDD
jgi:2-iminobutanoate/2-iminopropanoate deaminase